MAAYAEAPDVDLVAMAGMETDALQSLGTAYGIAEEHRHTNWQDLVDHCQLDLLSIAAPTTLHAPIAVAALDAGVHVLSEKPMAENAETARLMVESAERNDRVLDVSFNHRRRGHVQVLKKMIDDGLLGPIYYAKTGWLRREGIPGLGSWFTRRAVSGGGPLMDLGVHMLDIALYLLDEPQVRAVTAATYAEFGPRGKGSSPSPFMRKTGVEPRRLRRRGSLDCLLAPSRRRHIATGVELGAMDPERSLLRDALRVRRRCQYRLGRT